MNTSTRFKEELGHLDPYVGAVVGQSPAPLESARAQDRLVRRLEAARGAPAKSVERFRWRWAAAAAVLAVVATTLVPFMPGHHEGVAFADVQRRFESFETMHADMTTTIGGQVAMETRLVMDDEGRTRLDAGEMFSYVVDPGAGVMLQLFHQSRTAMEVPIGSHSAVPDEARLGWLEDIRSFQGEAVKLPERQVIDGTPVTGFRLEAGGMDMVLWATDGGEPVRLELHGGGRDGPRATTRMDFRFDRPVEPGSFDLAPPAGYTAMEGRPDPH